jgi:predicted nuclease of restriction endonuclease-like RecB superfamily
MANGGTHPLLGKKHKQETKVKLSKSASEQNKRYRGNYSYKSHKMRSSWEVAYAKWLDSNGIAWEYEPVFQLSDGRMYTPDFKLASGTIVEIKGYFREDAAIKWQMFCDEYSHIEKQLLMKKDLRLMGVL